MKSVIAIDHFEKSVFVCVLTTNRGIKPDVAFSRYTAGKEKPHYPVPATLDVSDTALIYTYANDSFSYTGALELFMDTLYWMVHTQRLS